MWGAQERSHRRPWGPGGGGNKNSGRKRRVSKDRAVPRPGRCLSSGGHPPADRSTLVPGFIPNQLFRCCPAPHALLGTRVATAASQGLGG